MDAVLREASRAGVSREDANDAAYAVVALADEIAMARSECERPGAGSTPSPARTAGNPRG